MTLPTRYPTALPLTAAKATAAFGALLGALSCVQSASPPPAAPTPPNPPSAASSPPTAQPAAKLSTQVIGVMPRGLTSVGAATLGDSLYLVGGYHGSPHDYSKEGQTGEVWRYDTRNGQWESLPGVAPIQSPAVVSDGKYVYKLGGLQHLNSLDEPTDMRSVAQAERFDPTTNQWQPLPDLPEGRSSTYAVVVGQTLYVVGGWLIEGGMYDHEWSETLLKADLSAPTFRWQTEKIPFGIRAEGLVARGEKIYVLGGIAPEGSTDAVHVYDTQTSTWTDGPDLPFDNMTTRGAVLDDELYANGADGNVYRLNDSASRWDKVGAVRFGRLFHEMVPSAQGPLVIAGIPNNGRGGRVRAIERLSTQLAPAGLVLQVPAATEAKNRQALVLWSQQLLIAGGNNSLGQHDFAPNNFQTSAARFDLGALAWRTVAEFPAPRQSMQATLLGEKDSSALVFGGFGFTEDRLTTQAETYRFDFRKQAWTAEPSLALPDGRSQFGLARWQGSVWTFGGLNYDAGREPNEQFAHTAEILRLDEAHLDAGFVAADFALSEPRRAFAGAQLDGKYYLLGGMRDGFAPVTSCEVVDLREGSTSPFPCPSEHRLGAELVALQGRLHLVGGSTAGEGKSRHHTKKIEIYDPATGQWTTAKAQVPLTTSEQLRASVYQDQLLLFSAHNQEPQVQVALLDPEALWAGREDIQRLDVPAPPPIP